MSRDNVLYGPELYQNLGDFAHYADRLEWNPPGGLGNYEKFAGMRLYTTENIHFAANYISVTLR